MTSLITFAYYNVCNMWYKVDIFYILMNKQLSST